MKLQLFINHYIYLIPKTVKLKYFYLIYISLLTLNSLLKTLNYVSKKEITIKTDSNIQILR